MLFKSKIFFEHQSRFLLTLVKDDYESEKFTDNKNSNKVIFTTYCDIKYE